MKIADNGPRRRDLREHGIESSSAYWDLGAAELLEHAIRRKEGILGKNGAFAVKTGQFTGRSPKDKFIVRDERTESNINWGPVNQAMSPEAFDRLYARLTGSLGNATLFAQDCFAGADPQYTLPIRVLTTEAWHALFAHQLFIRGTEEALEHHSPQFTLIFAPEFKADPATEETRTETCIVLNFTRKIALIVGTHYAGELKKSVFTILNYLLPEQQVFPMHCSANIGKNGRTALFFGLSGTGKTTLSADPNRKLIGDDEHGWSDHGVFNFEGGCYAKCIRLSQEKEPEIWNAIRFGTVLENVVVNPETRALDFDSEALTENTRAAYPIEFIDNAVKPSVGPQPSHVIFLTADAFGVLPPISKLTPELAMYHFLSGYTAKLAGTERGLGKEPSATFSACFGEPFLPRRAQEYAKMLGDRLRNHDVRCWLVNTGWVGGPYGVGERMKLRYTRAMVNAALEGLLDEVECDPHPVFGVLVPRNCPGVPAVLLDARALWSDHAAYDRAAADLQKRFAKNFEKFGVNEAELLTVG